MHSPLPTADRRPWRIVATASAALLLMPLAACSAGDAPAEEITSLTIPIQGQPKSFDPVSADLGEPAYVWTGLLDSLLAFDTDGTIIPNAAESFEYSEDATTLTLTIREGMTFSSGDEVTPAAVVHSLQRVISTPGVRSADAAYIDSVSEGEDGTVVIALTEPDPTLLGNLATALGAISDPATVDDENSVLDPVGSGPYTLDESGTVNGSTYVLEKRDDYWNADAYPFDRYTVRVFTDTQATYNALQTGELDAGSVSAAQVDGVTAAGFTVKPVNALSVASLAILDRTGDIVPALGDVRVRQALNMAFDRDLYLEQILQGTGQVTEQSFGPTQGGYLEELEGTYEYDPEGARELLAEAGYEDGFALTLPSTYFSASFEPAITQSLGDIGVAVEWIPTPPQDVVSSLSSGAYGAAVMYDGLNIPARMAASNFGPNGYLNPYGYSDPELAALLERAAATTDPELQLGIYEEVNTYAVENALTVPLLYTGSNWVTKEGVVYYPDGAAPSLSIRNYGLAD